jgi:hypothetical protein
MLRGIAITDFGQRESAAVGNLLRAQNSRRIVGKKSSKNIGGVESMFYVGLESTAARSHGNTIANGGQNILQLPAGWRVVNNLVRRHERESVPVRSFP